MKSDWFKLHMAYTAAKYSVSMYTLGMSQEFKNDNIAANSLWPKAGSESIFLLLYNFMGNIRIVLLDSM